MYNLREFRSKTKEAFDLAKKEDVLIDRNGSVYTLRISVKGSYSPRPRTKIQRPKLRKNPKEKINKIKQNLAAEVCDHGAARGFCRHANCKNSMFGSRNRL